jgi:DNA-binding protein HU-beta
MAVSPVEENTKNKQDLLDAVASQIGTTKVAVDETLTAVLATIMKEVSAGRAVQLFEFGASVAASARHAPVVTRNPARPSRLLPRRRSSLPRGRPSRTRSTRLEF